jgi:hypothetical protein
MQSDGIVAEVNTNFIQGILGGKKIDQIIASNLEK